ncbi:hypothetical protein JZ751_002068 [Albula glossodonta]|uniref:Uncharacterized protein n=1 Tax=Albula glossodonta TaxID=121402 RepID=A0A8T2P4D1_9TELE|nr:hypothetical protein JZ751_002068 [Albula glossodonta]
MVGKDIHTWGQQDPAHLTPPCRPEYQVFLDHPLLQEAPVPPESLRVPYPPSDQVGPGPPYLLFAPAPQMNHNPPWFLGVPLPPLVTFEPWACWSRVTYESSLPLLTYCT